jgi:hypothetical protein
MEGTRVFHGQLMQPEGIPHLIQLLRRRLIKAQPHETALAPAALHIRQLYRVIVLPAPVPLLSGNVPRYHALAEKPDESLKMRVLLPRYAVRKPGHGRAAGRPVEVRVLAD